MPNPSRARLLNDPLYAKWRLPWTAATWRIDASGTAYNTPTLGSELLTDPGLEAWSSATNLTSWTETVAGTSTVNQETTTIHGGSNAARLFVDGSLSNVSISQAITTTVGLWIYASIWMRSSLASGGNFRLDVPNTTTPTVIHALTDVFTQYIKTGRATTTGPIIQPIRQNTGSSHSAYLDDVSAKVATLSSLFSTVNPGYKGLDVGAALFAVVAGSQYGIVSHLDSAASPANFLLGYRNGGNLTLDKCVAGTYTNLISTSGSFVQGAKMEIRRPNPSANVFQLWYNGAQVGTDQTVNDAGIIDNALYGLFSTYANNLFLPNLYLGGRIVPFLFPGA